MWTVNVSLSYLHYTSHRLQHDFIINRDVFKLLARITRVDVAPVRFRAGGVRPADRDRSCFRLPLGPGCCGGGGSCHARPLRRGGSLVLPGPSCQRLSGPALGGPADSTAGGLAQGEEHRRRDFVCVCPFCKNCVIKSSDIQTCHEPINTLKLSFTGRQFLC